MYVGQGKYRQLHKSNFVVTWCLCSNGKHLHEQYGDALATAIIKWPMPLGARAHHPLKCEQNIVTKFMYTLDDIIDDSSKFKSGMFI